MSDAWVRYSEVQETRARLRKELRGWWKVVQPVRAWQKYHELRAASEGRRQAKNDRYLARRMSDPVLAKLNTEQRKAVLVQEDRTLIIAGAGTGKTHTIVEKAKDTVRTGIAKPCDLAFVTFTRKAAREIQSRCTEIKGMEIGTIHHLARQVIRLAEGSKPRLSPLVEDKKRRLDLLEGWLAEALREDPRLLTDLEIRKAAPKLCRTSDDGELGRPSVPPDGFKVKSMGEAQIATVFYLSGVKYIYEANFPVPEKFRSEDGKRYSPDFYLPDNPNERPDVSRGIWYEHFANDKNGRLPRKWDVEEPGSRAQYHEARRWKARLHKALGTRFTWTEYGDMQRCGTTGASFPDLVLQRVKELGLTNFTEVSSWNINKVLERMRRENANAVHLNVTHEIDAWIRASRQQVSLDKAREAAYSRREVMEESSALFRLAAPVRERYEQYLEETDTVDHEGTILKAWQYLKDGTVQPPWRVILVDEYQDVNPAQAAFVHALLRPIHADLPSTGARLTSVGDDWQAIFAFQGGDVDLIRDFRDPAGANNGCKSQVALRRTYRFGRHLADTTRHFATRSPGSIDRLVVGSPDIKPNQRWPSSVVLASSRLTAAGKRAFGAHHRGLTGSVLAALSRIATQVDGADVLILGRRNQDVGPLQSIGKREAGLEQEKICRFAASRNLQLAYSTIHKAKGIEGDYVILLDTGPPRAGKRAGIRALNRALSVFRKSQPTDEEERCIWYVGLTRAKRKVFVIVDAGAEAHSPFADELFHNVGGHYDVGEDELAEYLQPVRTHVPCPACSRRGREGPVLAVRMGSNGSFAGCTSFSAAEAYRCGHTERLCDDCEDGLMIRLGNGFAKCQAPNCTRVAPLCRCSVQKPMVKRTNSSSGESFWGCQVFPRGCRLTRSMSE